jgi:hypothetical protein
MSVSRNIVSCLGGNVGRTEELTGSLRDPPIASFDLEGVGMTPFDVKASRDVADVVDFRGGIRRVKGLKKHANLPL